MATRKQFEPINFEECLTEVLDPVGKFVPEMSLPIKDILAQFAFVDNIRLGDLAKRGYFIGDDDDKDFDLPDFDAMDIAEKEQYYLHCSDIVSKYQAQMAAQTEEPERTDFPAVDETQLP